MDGREGRNPASAAKPVHHVKCHLLLAVKGRGLYEEVREESPNGLGLGWASPTGPMASGFCTF